MELPAVLVVLLLATVVAATRGAGERDVLTVVEFKPGQSEAQRGEMLAEAARRAGAEGRPVLLRGVPGEEAHAGFARQAGVGLRPRGPSEAYFVDRHDAAGGRQRHWRIIEAPALRPEASQAERDSVNKAVDQRVREYLKFCAVDGPACDAFLGDDYNSMVPPNGSCYQAYEHSVIQSFDVSCTDDNLPFKNQIMNSETLVYWYLYLQSAPVAFLVYSLLDGLHTPNTVIDDLYNADGMYISNLEVAMEGTPTFGTSDGFYWSFSQPPTQNNVHVDGQTETITDSSSKTFSLGFNGECTSKGWSFGSTESFTSSYSYSTDITDWSTVETSDAVARRGSWKYYESWPVDASLHDLDTYGADWEIYYSEPWDPCTLKQTPNLSRYTSQTHDSVMWTAESDLVNPYGELDIEFKLNTDITVTGVTCTNYNGHHMMCQTPVNYGNTWILNIANLNNVLYNNSTTA
ncbi:hypothetical protein Pelo_3858 [Pelomyxa schiedti]|nr:hypothetical protein Pelo_3858 [Pelomyxa schiedti]